MAPHTSNWDFVLGELAYRSIGRKSGFLMKEQWFKWPLGYLFRSLGGIPVKKQRGSSLTDVIVAKYNNSDRLVLAITPEGTRSRTSNWRHGFLHIARQANIPLLLGAIDYKRKYIEIKTEFTPTSDVESDLSAVKRFYSKFNAKYPEKFSTSDE